MKGRFKSPIWVIPVLAMVVALGAFAVMAGINQFSAQPAEANIQEPGQGLTSTSNTELLTEPLETPLGFNATHIATGVTVQNNPRRAGAAAEYRIRFDTSAGAAGEIDVGEEIIVRFGRHFILPSNIDRNQVSISSSVITNAPGACGTVSDTVSPTSVTLETGLGDQLGETDVRLRVPDMAGGDNCSGNQGIGGGAVVTVIFQQSAGIMNPREGNTTGRPISVRATGDTIAQAEEARVPVPWRVEMSADRGSRGTSVTLVGTGAINNQQVTFWLDTNGDGVRDPVERDLCSAVAADNVATCTFSVSNPPFDPGLNPGAPNADCTLNSATFNCNLVNMRDGTNRTIFSTSATIFDQSELNRSVFILRSTVQVSPGTANVGDRVTVSLFDYPPNATIDRIALGGIEIRAATHANGATDPSLGSLVTGDRGIPTSGQRSFTLRLPGTVAPPDPNNPGDFLDSVRIPTGTQRLQVFSTMPSSDTDRFTNITLGGALLTLSHESVIGNQDLTLTGSGFTQRTTGTGEVCIADDQFTLANVPLQLDPNDEDCGLQNVNGKRLASGGTFTATVRVHQNDGTMPVALLTPGTHELRVRDTQGAEGTLTVTIPERSIEVTPASARPRDIVTIIGRQFVADNPDGLSTSVVITYDCGGGNTRSTTADPDASGNFRETLRIPTGCSIPSTSTITADIRAPGETGVVSTSTHEIPDALVRVEPVRGPQGSSVSVSGEGFRTFETVESIDFGGRGTLGGRTVTTDGQGNFRIDDLVVPGMDPGIRSVVVTVGSGNQETTASTSFEVVDTDVVGVPTDVIPGLATPLGDNLVRVFFFNNTTKVWQFHDPRPEFEDANTLQELIEGQPIWVRVMEDQTVELNGRERNLTCVNPGTPQEDCWNLIVW